MLNLGTAAAKITLDISDLTSKANRANATINGIGAGGAKNLDTLTGKISTYGASIQKVSTVVAGFGLAVTGAFGIAAKGAIGFDGAMGNVNSIAQLTKGQLSDLTNQVLDLSKATGQAPTTLADGLYDIESSGFAGADALKILTAAANAANAGLSDTGTSAAVITAVLNSYGLSADQAGHASDVLFQTVNDGVVTFGQLSQYMGQTLPIASALNVPIEQLGASYALMTKNGLPIAETQTDINALLTAALNPTTALTAAVQAHGYASAEDLIKTKGLSGYLDVLSDASGGSATALTELLGTQNASAAAMLLMKDGGKQYTDELAKMDAASKGLGATQTALNKQQDTTAFKLKLLAAAFSVLEIRIGQQLEPAINTVAEGLTKFANAISGLPTPVLAAIAAIGGVVGVVALVAGSIGLVLPKILEMKAAFGEVFALMRGGAAVEGAASSFSLLSPPILLVTAAIVGLGIAYKTNFLGFADGVKAAGSDLKDTWDGLTGGISNFIDNFGLAYDAMAPVKGVVGGISAGFKDLQPPVHAVGDAVGKVAGFLKSFNGAADSTKKSLDGVTGPAKSVGDAVNGIARGVNGVTDAVNPFNVGVGSATKHIQALYGTATGLARVLLALSYAFGQIGGGKFAWANDISTALLKAARYTQLFQNYFKAAFGGNAEKLLNSLPSPLRGIAHGIGTVLDAAHDLNQTWKTGGFTGVLNELPHVVGNLGTAFRQGMSGVGDLFRNAAQYAGPFSGTLKAIGKQFDDVGRIGQDMAKGLSYVMKGDWSTALKWGEHAVTDFGSLVTDSFKVVGNALQGLGSVAADLGAWTINTAAPAVTGWIADHAGDVWSGIKDVAGWVWGGLEDLGAWTLTTAVPTVAGWISDLAGGAWDLIKQAAGWTGSALLDLGGWILNTAAPNVGGWISDLAGGAWELIKQAAHWGEGALIDLGAWTLNSVAPTGLAGWIEGFPTDPAGYLQQAGANLIGFVATVKDWTLNLLKPAVSLAWDVIQTVVDKIGDVLVPLSVWTLLVAIPSSIKFAFDIAAAIGAEAAKDVGHITVAGIEWAINGIGSLGPAVASAISGASGDVYGAVTDAIKAALTTKAYDLGYLLGDAVFDVGGLVLDLANAISGGEEAIIGGIIEAFKGFNWSGIWDGIAEGIGNAPDIGGKILGGIAKGISIASSLPYLAIAGSADFAAHLADGFVTSLADHMGISVNWDGVGSAIGDGFQKAISVVTKDLPNKVGEIYSAFTGAVTDKFSDIQGFIDGILNIDWSKLGDGLQDVLDGIKNQFTSWYNDVIAILNKLPGMHFSPMLTVPQQQAKNASDAGGKVASGAKGAAQGAMGKVFGSGPFENIGADPTVERKRQQPGILPKGGGGGGLYQPQAGLAEGAPAIADMLANLSKMPSVANNAASGLKNLATSGIAAVTGQAVGATAATGLTKGALEVLGQTKAAPTISQQGAEGVIATTGVTSSALGALDAVKAMPKIDLDKTKLDAGIADARHYNGMTLATAIVSIVAKQAGQGVVAGAKGAAASAIAAAGNATVSTTTTNTVTTRFDAIDNASKIIALVASGITHVPTSWATALRQAGAEAVTGAAGVTQGALESIPVSWFTGISQSGAETVTRSAGFTQGALEDIPTSWFTGISQSGAEGVAGSAYDASGAISSIPTSWYSTIGASVSGVGDVLALASAINALHSVTIYVNTITTSGLSAVGNAKGGYTKGVPGWLAEQGPELLRFPDGSMGLAREKALYSVPAGTYVYTAPKTKDMFAGMDGPIPGYARGGYVRPWRAAAPTSVPTRRASQANQTIIYRTTVVQALKSDELQHLMEQAEAGGDLATNLGPRLTQIRQTASTPTVGRR